MPPDGAPDRRLGPKPPVILVVSVPVDVPTSTQRQKLRLLVSFVVLLVLIAVLSAEIRGDLGPSPLRKPSHRELRNTWYVRVINHPAIMILQDGPDLSLAALSDLEQGLDDPRLVGRVDLFAQWNSAESVWPPLLAERRLEINVETGVPPLATQALDVREQFLRLIESWGHTDIASSIRRGQGRAMFPRWDGIWAHARAWIIVIAFVVALVNFIGHAAMTWARSSVAPSRSERRRLQGLWARCEYPIKGRSGSICPECGEDAVPSETTQHPP